MPYQVHISCLCCYWPQFKETSWQFPRHACGKQKNRYFGRIVRTWCVHGDKLKNILSQIMIFPTFHTLVLLTSVLYLAWAVELQAVLDYNSTSVNITPGTVSRHVCGIQNRYLKPGRGLVVCAWTQPDQKKTQRCHQIKGKTSWQCTGSDSQNNPFIVTHLRRDLKDETDFAGLISVSRLFQNTVGWILWRPWMSFHNLMIKAIRDISNRTKGVDQATVSTISWAMLPTCPIK